MKGLLAAMALFAVLCIAFMGCGHTEYQDFTLPAEINQAAEKVADSFESSEKGKLREKLEEKASKDYTWILYKLWGSGEEQPVNWEG